MSCVAEDGEWGRWRRRTACLRKISRLIERNEHFGLVRGWNDGSSERACTPHQTCQGTDHVEEARGQST
eukprot:scaffold2859_cov349-Pavlova_lutheri.AAC.33